MTHGPTYLTSTPPTAYAGPLIADGDGALVGYGSTNRDGTRPRTLARLDAYGRPIAEEVLFAPPEGPLFGPPVELSRSSLGVLATSYQQDSCEVRLLGEPAIVLTNDPCRIVRPSPAGGVLLLLRGIGADLPNRQFGHLTSLTPPRLERGAPGLLLDAFGFDYEPLDAERIVVGTVPRVGGPVRAGVLDWRTGEGRLTEVHATDANLRRPRLLRHGVGWALGWIEQVEGDEFRLAMVQLDEDGDVVGPIVYPELGPVPETGWRMIPRGDELAIVYTDGSRMRIGSLDARFDASASVSTVAEVERPDQLYVVTLPDQALLMAFTTGSGLSSRVATLRAECWR